MIVMLTNLCTGKWIWIRRRTRRRATRGGGPSWSAACRPSWSPGPSTRGPATPAPGGSECRRPRSRRCPPARPPSSDSASSSSGRRLRRSEPPPSRRTAFATPRCYLRDKQTIISGGEREVCRAGGPPLPVPGARTATTETKSLRWLLLKIRRGEKFEPDRTETATFAISWRPVTALALVILLVPGYCFLVRLKLPLALGARAERGRRAVPILSLGLLHWNGASGARSRLRTVLPCEILFRNHVFLAHVHVNRIQLLNFRVLLEYIRHFLMIRQISARS